jgi:hypothetical protein
MSRFSKNPEEEDFLLQLNTALSGLESTQLTSGPERLPTIHVLGLPRSGTTLVLQQIVSGLDIGYINNLIAAFWMAPNCGIRLSRKLLPQGLKSSFNSEFGRTRSIEEPHEFGYFWSRHLGIDDMREPSSADSARVDWSALKRTIVSMCDSYERPIIFKNFYIGWYMAELMASFERAIVVRVSRDLQDVAMSLLRMREQMFGSKDAWASLKPREYSWLKREPYWVQVAGQVHFLDLAFQQAVSRVPAGRLVQTTLEEIRTRPNDVVNRVANCLSSQGFDSQLHHPIESEFSATTGTVFDPKDHRRVEKALTAFRDGTYG